MNGIGIKAVDQSTQVISPSPRLALQMGQDRDGPHPIPIERIRRHRPVIRQYGQVDVRAAF